MIKTPQINNHKPPAAKRQAARDVIDAARWRFLRDRYVKSIEHRSDGKAAFVIVLPRVRGTTIESVVDRLMGEGG